MGADLWNTSSELTLPVPAFPPEYLTPRGRRATRTTTGSIPALERTGERHAVADRPPPFLGRFQLGRVLGAGATATVYSAVDPRAGQAVALKVQRVGQTAARTAATVLDNERAILEHLRHPGVPRLIDAGITDDGLRWLAMPLLSGGDLRHRLRGWVKPDCPDLWPVRRRIGAFLTLCAAVEDAHGLGIVHRDLKPRNVLFDADDGVFLVDWGLAGAASPRPQPDEKAKTAPGTPGYMSPEQIAPRLAEIGPRSDQWSLGAILYELVTLQRAIPGTTVHERLATTLAGKRPDPRAHEPDLPEALVVVCERALSHRAADRFDSVSDLAIAVGSTLTDL